LSGLPSKTVPFSLRPTWPRFSMTFLSCTVNARYKNKKGHVLPRRHVVLILIPLILRPPAPLTVALKSTWQPFHVERSSSYATDPLRVLTIVTHPSKIFRPSSQLPPPSPPPKLKR
jgi:hypothetical protein